MPKLSDAYDVEVMRRMINESDEPTVTTEGEAPATTTTLPEYVFEKKDNSVLFSSLFWKPTTIPDLPVQVFEDTDWPEPARVMIPDPDPNWVWSRKELEAFALGIYNGDTILLWGRQGTGKSCLAKEWCATVRAPFWRINCNRDTRESHFLGSAGLTYNDKGQMFIKQEFTPLTDSLRYGGLFCEDEAFRHSSALVLQSLREKSSRYLLLNDAPGMSSEDRKLKAPAGRWWYVMTDNTCGLGDETGTFDAEIQDISTLDRIDTTIECDYLNESQEVTMLKKVSKLDPDILGKIAKVAKSIRQAVKSGTMVGTMSTRGVLSWVQKAEQLGSLGRAFQSAWYNKQTRDDQAIAKDLFFQVTGTTIED